MALLLALSATAGAQSLLVKPMSLELPAKPGQDLDVDLEVMNTATERAATIDVAVYPLAQNEAGWIAVEGPDPNLAAFPSCASWMRLARSSFSLAPARSETAKLRLTVPASAHGFYSAAVTVQSRRAASEGMGLVVRFLVPILVQIEGGVSNRRITVVKGAAQFVPAGESRPASLLLGANVRNQGGSLARVGGRFELYAKVGEQWLRVTSGESIVRRIIPNAEVRVSSTVEKRIPTGHYRVDAYLKADGQTLPRFSQELDVQGDPKIGAITADATLIPDPVQLEIESAPGSIRSTSVGLRNPTAEPVTVLLAASTPPALQGIALGDVKGDQYSGSAWTTVSPSTIVIGANQERKVRVAVAMPPDARLPYYYSTVTATLQKNGEAAGTSRILVVAHDKAHVPKASMQPTAGVGVAHESGTTYSLSAAFGNDGDVHLTPKLGFTLMDVAKITAYRQIEGTIEGETVLPLSIARFTGTLNAVGLKPGVYAVLATCSYADRKVASETLIRVSATPAGPRIDRYVPRAEGPAKAPAKPKAKG